jgi:NitT/TauT family transport system substrate-binding protein
MKRRSMLSSSLLFALSLSVTAGCNSSSSDTKNMTAVSKTGGVKLGFSAWPGWFPWQVAQDKSIFQANKVDVDLQWFDNYVDSIKALQTGKIDANCQTLADTISAIDAGADLVVVLTNDNSTGNDKIIVSDQIKSIQDLKGKKVAAEEGTVDHFLLVQALQKAGMKIQDVQFIPMETGRAADAFVAGEVDAVAVFAPFTTKAFKRPKSIELFSSNNFRGSISDHLVFTRKFVKEHPEQVQAIVNSWFGILDFMKTGENQKEAEAIMAKKAGVSIAEYQEYNDGTKIFGISENLETFQNGKDITYLSQAAIEAKKFLTDNKLIKTDVNISNLLDDRFIKAYAARK